jgi:hypothetical protein
MCVYKQRIPLTGERMRMAKRCCARCGEQVPTGKHIYSKYTKNYYCFDLDECEERAKLREHNTVLAMVREMADNVRREIESHGFEAI